VFIVRITCKT